MSSHKFTNKKLLADLSKRDVKQLNIYLQELEKLNINDTTNYLKNLISKSGTSNIYNITSQLLQNPKSLENIDSIYENDKSMLPLMIYENYCNYTNPQAYSDIVSSFAINDLVEEHVYSYQKWGLSSIQIFFSVINPINIINENTKRNFIKLRFIKEIHKTSAKNSNKKIIKYYKNIFNKDNTLFSFDQENINCFNKIVNESMNKKSSPRVAELLNHYRLTHKDIQSLFNTSKQLKENKTISNIKKRYSV
jgi:hypothetical protein